MNSNEVPLERLERNPLMTGEGYRLLNRILQHPCAPKWNFVTGDRITGGDLPHVEAYREAVFSKRPPASSVPPPDILHRIRDLRDNVGLFRMRLPLGLDLEKEWAAVPAGDREDLAVRINQVVPWDADLSRLIVYDTSGSTGHALKVPHHPLAMAKNHALMEYALARHGVRPVFGPEAVACINLGAQEVHTVVFANVFSVWKGSGFAKVNLVRREWPGIREAGRFFAELAPLFLTGDPVGYAELLRWEIPVRPAALISTAVALGQGLKGQLEKEYGCPVIDWYSTTETGPLAYSCPLGHGLHVLPHDVFVEVLDGRSEPVPEGERGEIAVTGGHNPYVPLLRYRTGDWGRMAFTRCDCGELSPRILGLEGRSPVLFRSASGDAVNAVDIGRVLRRFPVVQHEVVQRADGSCDVALRDVPGAGLDLSEVESALREILGDGISLSVRRDDALGERLKSGKLQPYRSEMGR
jgi:phenylacetate-CoA ligase